MYSENTDENNEKDKNENELSFEDASSFNQTIISTMTFKKNALKLNSSKTISNINDITSDVSSTYKKQKINILYNYPEINYIPKIRKESDIKDKNKEKNSTIKYFRNKYTFIKTFNNNKIKTNELIELQNFKADTEQIWAMNISPKGNYLATGGKTGILKVWILNDYNYDVMKYNSIYYSYLNSKEFKNIIKDDEYENKAYINYINENAFRIYYEHKSDIIGIEWSNKYENYVISASFDKKIILYDVQEITPLKIFKHVDDLICINFCPDKQLTFKNNNIQVYERDEFFASSCFDQKIFIWNIFNSEQPFYCIHSNEIITSICFFPDCTHLCLGSSKGNVFVYDIYNNFRYEYSFHVKNKNIKTSLGKKITSIKFIKNDTVLISTNDDRIRLINIKDGNVIQKFKGHKNTDGMLKVSYNENYDLIIAPSEDYYIYIWNIKNSNKLHTKKNYNYIYFKPTYQDRREFVTETLFINENKISEYNQKLNSSNLIIYIKNIIICSTNKGFIHVLLEYYPINN